MRLANATTGGKCRVTTIRHAAASPAAIRRINAASASPPGFSAMADYTTLTDGRYATPIYAASHH
jgi:hypothetical protein